jgi:hypothetical protein
VGGVNFALPGRTAQNNLATPVRFADHFGFFRFSSGQPAGTRR